MARTKTTARKASVMARTKTTACEAADSNEQAMKRFVEANKLKHQAAAAALAVAKATAKEEAEEATEEAARKRKASGSIENGSDNTAAGASNDSNTKPAENNCKKHRGWVAQKEPRNKTKVKKKKGTKKVKKKKGTKKAKGASSDGKNKSEEKEKEIASI